MMNTQKCNEHTEYAKQKGYKIIFEDTEQKYDYFVLKGSQTKKILRGELIEMINAGKTMPVIEIREKSFEASKPANS